VSSSSSGGRSGARAAGELLDQPPGDGRREQRSAGGHDADRGHELLLGDILEQEAARPRAQRLVDVLVEVEGGEHEHARPVGHRDAARGLDAVDARHADVHEHDVGQCLPRARDRLGAVARLADDLDVGLRAQDHAKARAHEALVVGEQDADHRAAGSGSRTRSA
jgi:hypothetical protein